MILSLCILPYLIFMLMSHWYFYFPYSRSCVLQINQFNWLLITSTCEHYWHLKCNMSKINSYLSHQIGSAFYISHFSDITDLPVNPAQNTAIILSLLFLHLHVQLVTFICELFLWTIFKLCSTTTTSFFFFSSFLGYITLVTSRLFPWRKLTLHQSGVCF